MTRTTTESTRDGALAVEHALRTPKRPGQPALVAFVTAGYPSRAAFPAVLRRVAAIADVVEVGIPFSDPMADGPVIQAASRQALDDGTSLRWVLEVLGEEREALGAPVLLMSYLNPLLRLGDDGLHDALVDSGVAGTIVPDLPFEEADAWRRAAAARGRAAVQLVTPVTPPARRHRLAAASTGFVYAVTRTGITGAGATLDVEALRTELGELRRAATVPVCAGFGVRAREQVVALGAGGVVDGVIVGTALVERIGRGEDPGVFLSELVGAAPARDEPRGGEA